VIDHNEGKPGPTGEVAMKRRRRLEVQDALWLEMDRPNNLMVVDSVIWTAEPLDFAQVRAVVEERLLNRYPVFAASRSRMLTAPGGGSPTRTSTSTTTLRWFR